MFIYMLAQITMNRVLKDTISESPGVKRVKKCHKSVKRKMTPAAQRWCLLELPH